MRRFALALLTTTSLIGFAGAASAADIAPAYKAPPVAAPLPFSWTGFYLGIHGGGGWGDADWTQTFSSLGAPLDASSHDLDGWLFGGQVGFNYQVGMWVLGLEGELSWTDIDGTGTQVLFPAFTNYGEVEWLGTIAGRLGIAWDRALLYAKGGVAFSDANYDIAALGVTAASQSDTRVGWLLGVGLEYAFWDNWSAKLEYNYMDFGTDNYRFTDAFGNFEDWDIDHHIHTIKVGINYRFGGPY